jgi:hypothetical protein
MMLLLIWKLVKVKCQIQVMGQTVSLFSGFKYRKQHLQSGTRKRRISHRTDVAGLNKPVNDLSRGCTVDDIINTVVITAIQAWGCKFI